MPATRQKVAIVGAGIGGLTAAIAFARNGAEVFVYEQAAALREVGAGIQITPNGARVLNALGVQQHGIAAQAVVPMDAITGRAITRFDLSNQSPLYRFYHRTSLQEALIARAHAVGVIIKTGVKIKVVAESGMLLSADGEITADIIVGADGIHAVTRGYCNPGASKAVFTGQVAWRAIVPMSGMAPEAHIWMGQGRHVVTYPLSDHELNVVAVEERTDWAAEGWHHADDPANLQAAFSGCSQNLRALLAQVEDPRLWGLFQHAVVSRWSKGAVALLGDAAHPTLPFLAQGANLAIEDAYVLARCCHEHTHIRAAFARYQQLRHDRVVRAISTARANAGHYHVSGLRRKVAHAGLRTLGAIAPNAFINRLGWLYDHDVTL